LAKNKKRKKAQVIPLKNSISPKRYVKEAARKLPIYKIYMQDDLLESGLGQIIVIREKKSGEKLLGLYMVDPWCLGLKDSDFFFIDEDDYEPFFKNLQKQFEGKLIPVEPNFAFNLIYGAIEYAEDLGFEPDENFAVTEYILDDVESLELVEIPFGKNGKPTFIPGPGDHIGKILKTLTENVGEDGFTFLEFEDDDDEDPLFDMEIGEMLPDAEDNKEFMNYMGLLSLIATLFTGKEKRLMDLYLNDKTTLAKEVSKHLDLIYDKEPDSNIIISQKILLPIVENYIIYGAIGFISQEPFKEAFISDVSEEEFLPNLIHQHILYEYGTQKINALLLLLGIILEKDNDDAVKRKAIDKILDEARNDFEKMADNNVYEVIAIVDHLMMYEDTFGKITDYKLESPK